MVLCIHFNPGTGWRRCCTKDPGKTGRLLGLRVLKPGDKQIRHQAVVKSGRKAEPLNSICLKRLIR
jgi:hypothetical protein